jgi:GT2 family glycosyltransferase
MIPVITIYKTTIPKLLLKNQHSFFDKVILVYNSEIDTKKLHLPNNCYVLKNLNKNFVAGALNKGIKFGIKQGHNTFLLLDDDSSFIDEKDILELNKKKIDNEIFQLRNTSDKLNSEITITNGTVISKRIFDQVGCFSEEMGIDLVDVEYFFRVKKSGFNFLRTSKIYLEHNLGYYNDRLIPTPNYNSFRYYKQTKNLILLTKKFWTYFPSKISYIIIRKIYYFSKIILFEKNRFSNIKFILKGLYDGF